VQLSPKIPIVLKADSLNFHLPSRAFYTVALALLLWSASVVSARADAILQLFNLSWNQVADKMPEIAEAGYSSLWLPPPVKAGSAFSVGYDVFDPFDLGDKDQRGTIATQYGTKQELLRLVRIAHRFGLRVYFDNIVNHRGFDVPGYDSNTPTNLYPGMVPGDFHLMTIAGGFFRNVSNIRDYNDPWQVQNLSLSGLLDISQENPNANFGPTEGSTASKPVLVRHPNNPEYYDFNSAGVRVGFGKVTQANLNANPNAFKEDVGAYLIRSVRYLIDQTKCDGLRLDAVKHVPSYFFGLQSGANKDTDSSGYVGNAQLQFNLTHGFNDPNHRDSNFDTETPRTDALIFGEHLGEPPAYSEYTDAGMRLLDSPLRNYLNNVLGNPSASLAGLDQRDSGGFSASVRVMHAQSHDNDYAAHRELQNAYYFTREGVPLIYSDGYHEATGNPPFPRNAKAPYLGEFGDNKMPDLAYLHHQLARGGTRSRWSDSDVVAYERYDYRESTNASDQTVLLFAMNDNYAGDISFDDGVAQNDSGVPSTCYPVVNVRPQGLVVGFPPGSHLRQLADSPGKERACPELLVRLATNDKTEAQNSINDTNPVNRKVYVGSQTLAPGGGAIEFKIPSGSYVLYGYQWPEPSRVDATLTNSAGVVTNTDAIIIQQAGRVVPRVTVFRTDGPNGDAGFNPIYPFKMRGSLDSSGNMVGGSNLSNLTYSISIPVITNTGPLDFLVRVDGSAANALLKLDGGMDLNSQMGLGASNTFTQGVLDLRDNKPGLAYDTFLGYEQCVTNFHYGPEKFAARNIFRDTVQSLGAETFYYTVGSDITTTVVNGIGLGNAYSEETAAWVYHDPSASNNITGKPVVRQRSSTASPASVDVYVKVGYQFNINKCLIYYTTDNTNPEGAYGVGQGTTRTVEATFAGDDASDATIDWWKGTIPAVASGTVRYKIGLYKNNAAPIVDYADSKHYALAQFALTNWNPASAQVWLHNDLATNQIATGLADGFHILRARAFLPRANKSSVFNTFLQTFYYDVQPPDGVIAFPTAATAALNSVDYDFVVRADDTTTDVEYNVIDGDPNNDDANTGFHNGNGLSSGQPVFAKAARVSPLPSLTQQYPNFLQEFRFTYFAVPSNGTATIKIRLKEITSAASTNHYRELTRTISAAAPPQTVSIAFPSASGQNISLSGSNVYTIVTCFSSTLTPDINLFTIRIDGADQPRTNNAGVAAYHIQGSYCGPGKSDLRYDWSGMSSGQHYIQVIYNGDGLNLQASRLVHVTVSGQTDTDGDGLPDTWETQYGLNPFDGTGANGPDGDPDGDHFTNLQEYLAGTNPMDPASFLRITQLSGGGQVVSWSSVPGKNYQVFATSGLGSPFQVISGTITAFGGTTSFTNSAPVSSRQFYRVQVGP